MNLTLRQLKGFIGVAASGSFTRTAQRLHVSQAALSSAVRELETQLDCRLFHRTTRAVELTPAGRRFVTIATRIVESLESAAIELAEIGREDATTLRIGVTPMMASSLLPILLDRFRQQAPAVEISVTDSAPAELQQLTEAGHLDAAYGAFFSKVSGLHQHPIFATRLQVVRAVEPAGRRRETMHWQELAGRDLILVQAASPLRQLIDAELVRHAITPSTRYVVNQLETVIAFAEAGLGLGIVPSFAIAACRRYAVMTTTLTPAVEFRFHRITRAGHQSSAALDAFTSLFASVAAELDEVAKPVARKKQA